MKKDGVNTDIYQAGLADLWVGQDGKRYGLPKDFDTVSVFYNKKLIEDGGFKEADLANMTWNPDDGGTYEKIIAHLTVDQNGKRGDEAGFDKSKVKVYGLGLDGGSGGANGQTQWSMYTGTLPWQFTDKNPWGTHYNYDDPNFQKSMGWMRSLIAKGYMPSVEAVTGQSATDLYGAGKYAMLTDGSWVLGQMYGYKGVETGTAPTPVGPSGKRSSMYNGLADSIWVGSKNKPAAAKWVEFLGSADCQDIVGEKGVVFPAVKTSTDKAAAAFKAKGINTDSFLIHVKDGTTFLFPITDHASEITNIMNSGDGRGVHREVGPVVADRRQQPGQRPLRVTLAEPVDGSDHAPVTRRVGLTRSGAPLVSSGLDHLAGFRRRPPRGAARAAGGGAVESPSSSVPTRSSGGSGASPSRRRTRACTPSRPSSTPGAVTIVSRGSETSAMSAELVTETTET